VLVVEPQADIRHLLRHVLQLQGYRVLVAGDPGEALSIVADRPEPVHLLLMDAPPPGTPALAGRLAAVHPGMRALYLSSAPPATAGRPGAPDPATILRKPFTMTSLLGKVRELLGG
jgi:CheY-like chemotaxis protein